jgi:hypothetical protein
MLSRHSTGLPQCGQRERGVTTDWSAGSRTMQTFRKLPIRSPKSLATIASSVDSPRVTS